ncbi:hypothetical protein [uncultured Mediterranean phage]|nr:hypothetical protein [uncultured Mediterranean phage]
MIPIRATRHYIEEVDYNPEKHGLNTGQETVAEKRMARGYITDIISLLDVGVDKSIGSDKLMQKDGVWVIFWEDKGDNYQLQIEDWNNITVSTKEMNEYVKTARHGV